MDWKEVDISLDGEARDKETEANMVISLPPSKEILNYETAIAIFICKFFCNLDGGTR